ncbi:hypothetical protein CLOM_g24122 [Closterium sp. NIES-68]|nr:hypothetical protein CLOM_g24122 [Closterium sp. NIES-68]
MDAQEITTRLVLAYELLLEEAENPTGRRWRSSGSGGGWIDDEEEDEEMAISGPGSTRSAALVNPVAPAA